MAEEKMTKMRSRACISCGEALPGEALLELDHMPSSAQDIPGKEKLKEDRDITLRLCQCRKCGLVQLDCDPVPYYRDVIRSGGYSTTMVELRRRQYEHLIRAYELEGKKFIEVGCGQGEFLSVLSSFPVTACGIEHKQELVELAMDKGLDVCRDFTETVSTRIEGGPYDAFLSFNFLEHQPDPVTMLRCIRENLTEGGIGLVTVPSFEYILQYDGYYELIRDHLAYYTFDTLRYVMARGDFKVLEEEVVNRDTLSVIVRKQPEGGRVEMGAKPSDMAVKPERETKPSDIAGTPERETKPSDMAVTPDRETKPSDMAVTPDRETKPSDIAVTPERETKPSDMAVKPESRVACADLTGLREGKAVIGREIRDLTERYRLAGKTLALWGAGHQGFTLASSTALRENARYIIDSAPFKQGLFAPASHIPIVPPEHYEEEPADGILIVAPGYTEEIAGLIRKRWGGAVQILTLRSNHIEQWQADGAWTALRE